MGNRKKPKKSENKKKTKKGLKSKLRKCFQANPSDMRNVCVSCSAAFVVVEAAGHTLVGGAQSDISHIKKISSRIIFFYFSFFDIQGFRLKNLFHKITTTTT